MAPTNSKRNYIQGQENIPSNILTVNEQKILKVPGIVDDKPVYNHGQEAISMPNNERSTLQNIDENVLQQIVQVISQEISTRQNNNN